MYSQHYERTAVAILLLFPSLLCAQAPCPEQTVAVTVLGENGEAVEGLDTSSFQGTFHQKPVRIVSVIHDEQSRRILLLLDVSGSMTEQFKWEFAIDHASDFVKNVDPRASLSFVTFKSTIEERMDFTADRTSILARLDQLRAGPRGNTNITNMKTSLRDALVQAVMMLEPTSRDAIYVITDGGDNKSKANWDNVRRTVLARKFRLFVLLLNDTGFVGQQAEGTQEFLNLARESGGTVLTVPRYNGTNNSMHLAYFYASSRLAHLFPVLYRQMTEFYILGLDLSRLTSAGI